MSNPIDNLYPPTITVRLTEAQQALLKEAAARYETRIVLEKVEVSLNYDVTPTFTAKYNWSD